MTKPRRDASEGGVVATLKQDLHAATGDRKAEAAALAERSGDDVSEAKAMIAVREAHGDVTTDDSSDVVKASEIADPSDARAVRIED